MNPIYIAPVLGERSIPLNLPAFCCPLCKCTVEKHDAPSCYRCLPCERTYPIVDGIPDFRVWSDPYIESEDDWDKGKRVWREGGGRFSSMLEAYWRLTPDVPSAMAARFVRYAQVGAARGRSRLDRIGRARGIPIGSADTLLDVGCGSGGLVVAASQRAGAVVGVDIAARWLVVARAQLEEAGVRNALLVCACAEFLPFPDETFDVVVANDVLEHCQDQPRLLDQIRRCLRPAGMLLLSTQNRWSLLGEPHVRLWGVGFLPRRWMATYVRLARHVHYRFIRLVSPPELKRLLIDANFRDIVRLVLAPGPEEVEGLSRHEQRQVRLYDALSKQPVLRWFLFLFGPVLEVVART